MFHFTIRDVLWLTVAVAVSCAWALSNRQWQSRLDSSEAQAKHFQNVAAYHQQRHIDTEKAIEENRQREKAIEENRQRMNARRPRRAGEPATLNRPRTRPAIAVTVAARFGGR
jgi:hypothetical protein